MRVSAAGAGGDVGTGPAGRVVAVVGGDDGRVVAVVTVGRFAVVVVVVDAAGPVPGGPVPGGPVSVVAGAAGPAPGGRPRASRAWSAVNGRGCRLVTSVPTRATPCQARRIATVAAANHPIP